MAILGSKKRCAEAVAAAPWYACATGGDLGKVPKGYFPVMLVDDGEDDEQGQRILVPVKMLREPCMEALLELAEQQFGYGQRGVLRIPCTAIHFQHIINGLMKNNGGSR
ncbi:indole-3-acetic acid-induced protein ARG7 [Setaria italica]|nr:indole-3-acetic acid-induced protein ARG7 [Setaria italica]